jgi:hypothetical protein
MAQQKITILVATAMVNEDGRQAGMYENVDVDEDRADYLVSIGAAKYTDEKAQRKAEASADAPEKADEDAEGSSDAKAAPKPATRRPAARHAGK